MSSYPSKYVANNTLSSVGHTVDAESLLVAAGLVVHCCCCFQSPSDGDGGDSSGPSGDDDGARAGGSYGYETRRRVDSMYDCAVLLHAGNGT